MARGWESKAITDQMEEADKRAKVDLGERVNRSGSPELRARHEKLESLRLSRARTLAQLERATNPAYREMLGRTLRALEAEVEALN